MKTIMFSSASSSDMRNIQKFVDLIQLSLHQIIAVKWDIFRIENSNVGGDAVLRVNMR